jgi:ribonuclease P protein component
MRLKLAKHQRLKDKALIDRVFTEGKKITADKFAIFFYFTEINFSRLGIIISKKNVKTAVKRNLFRRIVRESFRINQHLFKACDVVVLAYKGAALLNKKELRAGLEKQWQKLISCAKPQLPR